MGTRKEKINGRKLKKWTADIVDFSPDNVLQMNMNMVYVLHQCLLWLPITNKRCPPQAMLPLFIIVQKEKEWGSMQHSKVLNKIDNKLTQKEF